MQLDTWADYAPFIDHFSPIITHYQLPFLPIFIVIISIWIYYNYINIFIVIVFFDNCVETIIKKQMCNTKCVNWEGKHSASDNYSYKYFNDNI